MAQGNGKIVRKTIFSRLGTLDLSKESIVDIHIRGGGDDRYVILAPRGDNPQLFLNGQLAEWVISIAGEETMSSKAVADTIKQITAQNPSVMVKKMVKVPAEHEGDRAAETVYYSLTAPDFSIPITFGPDGRMENTR